VLALMGVLLLISICMICTLSILLFCSLTINQLQFSALIVQSFYSGVRYIRKKKNLTQKLKNNIQKYKVDKGDEGELNLSHETTPSEKLDLERLKDTNKTY